MIRLMNDRGEYTDDGRAFESKLRGTLNYFIDEALADYPRAEVESVVHTTVDLLISECCLRSPQKGAN